MNLFIKAMKRSLRRSTEGNDLFEALKAVKVTDGGWMVSDAPSNQAFDGIHHLEHISEGYVLFLLAVCDQREFPV